MITLTITLRRSEHQITLAFNSEESMRAKVVAILNHGDVKAEDDFGHTFYGRGQDILAITTSDLDKHWPMIVKQRLRGLSAENDYNAEVQRDPTLKFLVGGKHGFGQP